MSIRVGSLVLGVALVGVFTATASAQTVTVSVDCAAGGSINAALRTPAESLVVDVEGTCVEDVQITRDAVTLRGRAGAGDGIRATEATFEHSAVAVQGARQVEIEDLTLAGSFTGLRVAGGQVRVSRCHLADNDGFGAELRENSAVSFHEVKFTGGQLGGLSVSSGNAVCRRCTIAGNVRPDGLYTYGVVASHRGDVSLTDSTIADSTVGLHLYSGASGSLYRSHVASVREALRVESSSVATVQGGTLDGAFYADAARLRFIGVRQTPGSTTNSVRNDSFLQLDLGAVRTELARATSIERFSRAYADRATLKELWCSGGADAFCSRGSTVAASSCRQCAP